jgi:hypothetical protein
VLRALVFIALSCAASVAHADGEFALDFAHWNNTPLANASQTLAAKAYLRGIMQIEPQYAHSKIGQLICAELTQDLLPAQHFYYCRLVFEANAIDGGPFDEGSVMAWDGKVSAFHQESLDPRDAQARVLGLRFLGAEALAGMKSLPPKVVKAEDAATALTKAVNLALARRIATAKGEALIAVTKFLCKAHYDTNYLVDRPPLPSLAELKKANPQDQIDPEVYARARASPHKIFAYSRSLRAELVAVRVEPAPGGFVMDEMSVLVHYTHPG